MQYFVEHQGLIRTGWDIKTIVKVYVSKAKVCKVLGPKFDKNGWKFKFHTNKIIELQIQDLIIDLYTRVYEKRNFLNDTITLEFARALIVQNNGAHLNWATYALATHEKKVSLQLIREKQVILQPPLP